MTPLDTSGPRVLPQDAQRGLGPLSRPSSDEETPRATRLRSALAARLRGPGGYYNVGNALGLAGGIAIAVATAESATGARAAFDHLAGSASALFLTAAMLVFFWSGEAYHRAWANGFPPDRRLNRQGDLLSGVGAVGLGMSLFLIAEPLLGATAGALHAAGKFGSAVHPPRARAGRWPDPWRAVVVASRLPALALVTLALAAELAAPGGAAPLRLATPALLLICYLLWVRADLLLFRS